MLLLLLLVCAVAVLVDDGIDVVADVVGEKAVDRSDTNADEGGVETVVVRKADDGWEIAVLTDCVARVGDSGVGDAEVVALEDVLDDIAARPAAII